jgi:hypothetical protein
LPLFFGLSAGYPTCSKSGFSPNQDGGRYFLEHEWWGLLQIAVSNVPSSWINQHRALTTTYFEMGEPTATNIVSEYPIAEFATLSTLRDRLVDATLNGRKVSTTALALEREVEREPPQSLAHSVVCAQARTCAD